MHLDHHPLDDVDIHMDLNAHHSGFGEFDQQSELTFRGYEASKSLETKEQAY